MAELCGFCASLDGPVGLKNVRVALCSRMWYFCEMNKHRRVIMLAIYVLRHFVVFVILSTVVAGAYAQSTNPRLAELKALYAAQAEVKAYKEYRREQESAQFDLNLAISDLARCAADSASTKAWFTRSVKAQEGCSQVAKYMAVMVCLRVAESRDLDDCARMLDKAPSQWPSVVRTAILATAGVEGLTALADFGKSVADTNAVIANTAVTNPVRPTIVEPTIMAPSIVGGER